MITVMKIQFVLFFHLLQKHDMISWAEKRAKSIGEVKRGQKVLFCALHFELKSRYLTIHDCIQQYLIGFNST